MKTVKGELALKLDHLQQLRNVLRRSQQKAEERKAAMEKLAADLMWIIIIVSELLFAAGLNKYNVLVNFKTNYRGPPKFCGFTEWCYYTERLSCVS